MMTAPHLLVLVFSVLDTNVWDFKTLSSWADSLLAKVQRPKSWLIDLSLSTSVEESIEVVRRALPAENVVLPDDVGDLLTGLTWMLLKSGKGDSERLRMQLVEMVDAYGARSIDAESLSGFIASRGEALPLGLSASLDRLAVGATEQLQRLTDPDLFKRERDAIEN